MANTLKLGEGDEFRFLTGADPSLVAEMLGNEKQLPNLRDWIATSAFDEVITSQ